MVAAGWSEAQKRAYVLADNQLAITGSGWDTELLRLDRRRAICGCSGSIVSSAATARPRRTSSACDNQLAITGSGWDTEQWLWSPSRLASSARPASLGIDLSSAIANLKTAGGGSPCDSRVHWVRPELVAEVKFLAWTEDNLLRQVVYEGLREDKPPKDVRLPIPHPQPAR
jgi:hypothetical protein